MRKYWESREFECLEAEWDQKLKEAGFEDAEEKVKGERLLKYRFDRSLFCWKDRDELTHEARQHYFLMLSELVDRETEFAHESDKIIMERTAEGRKISEISKELKTLKKFKSHPNSIRFVRRRYEHKWGIKSWMPEQMVSRKVRIR